MISENQLKLVEIKAEKAELLPKKAMSIGEFNAIRAFYSGADFERNSTMPMSIFITSGFLWFV